MFQYKRNALVVRDARKINIQSSGAHPHLCTRATRLALARIRLDASTGWSRGRRVIYFIFDEVSVMVCHSHETSEPQLTMTTS